MTTQSMRGTRGGNRNDDLHTSCRAWVYSEDNADDVEARGDKKGGNDVGGGGTTAMTTSTMPQRGDDTIGDNPGDLTNAKRRCHGRTRGCKKGGDDSADAFHMLE